MANRYFLAGFAAEHRSKRKPVRKTILKEYIDYIHRQSPCRRQMKEEWQKSFSYESASDRGHHPRQQEYRRIATVIYHRKIKKPRPLWYYIWKHMKGGT